MGPSPKPPRGTRSRGVPEANASITAACSCRLIRWRRPHASVVPLAVGLQKQDSESRTSKGERRHGWAWPSGRGDVGEAGRRVELGLDAGGGRAEGGEDLV